MDHVLNRALLSCLFLVLAFFVTGQDGGCSCRESLAVGSCTPGEEFDDYSAECEDGNECTASDCINNACSRPAYREGEPCNSDGTCRAGVCDVGGTGGTGGSGGTGGMGATGGTGGGGGTGGTGGSAGTGGPCSSPLPESPPGLIVDVYAAFDARPASVDTRPGGISFADDGTLFAGNAGGPDPQQQTVPVLQVNPMANQILTSNSDVRDPDAVIVDNTPSLATAPGNVFAGGENMQGIGQLTELTPNDPFDIVDGADILGSCIDNVTVMLFDQSGRLLIGNFDQSVVSAAVCAVQRNSPTEIEVLDFIETLPGAMTDPILGIVQEPDGDLFVSQDDSVHRFDSEGQILVPNYTTGTAVGYGPGGSAFDGLLILRGGVLFLRSNLADDQNDEALLTFTPSTGTANNVAFHDANLYISQLVQKRILRVSANSLLATDLGCPPQL